MVKKCVMSARNLWCFVTASILSFACLGLPATVTYCVHPNWVPYEMLRNHSHVGISSDYLALIGELSGLQFELVETQSWQQSLSMLQSGECMMLPMVTKAPTYNRFLTYTAPYFASPNVLISADVDIMFNSITGLSHQLVAVDKHSHLAEFIIRYYPNIRLQLKESEAEAIDAVVSGEADVMAGALFSVNSQINKTGLNNLVVTGYLEPVQLLRMGVNQDYPELVDALNQAIEQIPEASDVTIYKRWNNSKSNIRQDFHLSILVVICGGLLIASIVWRKKLLVQHAREKRFKQQELENLQSVLLEKNRMLEFLSSHDTATNLYNRNFMLHRAEDEVSRFNRFHTAASLILFDFSSQSARQINNKPSINEEGIKELAKVCLSCVREVDIAGRWNVEQLIILCPQTPISSSKILADRLKEAVEGHHNDEIRNLPFSIGLASLQEGESFSEWYERASQALYLARRQHNGKVMIAEA